MIGQYGSGLSPPTSRVRTTSGRPSRPSSTRRYSASWVATSGAWGWAMKISSVRSKPTPSAPCSTTLAIPLLSPMLANTSTAWPSRVTAGSKRLAQAACKRCSRASRSASARCNSSSGGATLTTPRWPSSSNGVPACSSRIAAPAPTTAGMPKARATMALCAVAPPWAVTIPATRLGSSRATSDGPTSVITST
ncbi:hypothetical protein D3C76_899370 [compost metagenome]